MLRHLVSMAILWAVHCACFANESNPVIISYDDLNLDGLSIDMITPSLILKRAADQIAAENDVKDTSYSFAYKTDDSEHEQRGYVINGKLMVMGAFSVTHPNGAKSMTLYTADKNGYRAQIKFNLSNQLLKSAVGK